VYLLSDTRQTIKSLSQGRPYYEIYCIFQKSLATYATKLKERLETLEGKGSRVLTEEEVKQTCVILNTAYYCSTTTKEIEASFKSDIDEQYKEKVMAQHTVDIFEGLIAQCLKALVRTLSIKLTNDGSGSNLRSIVTTNWNTWETVGDQSEYINTVQSELTDMMTLFRNIIVDEHFTFLCDSVAKAIIQLFEAQLWLIRGISEIGAEQLLVDATSLKGVLTRLPVIGAGTGGVGEEGPKVSERFIKRIEKEMGPIEKLLKILMTPKEMLAETYKQMFHQAPTVHQFIKILNLKGISRAEQGGFLDQYGVKPNDPLRQSLINQPEPKKLLDFDSILRSIDFDNFLKKKDT